MNEWASEMGESGNLGQTKTTAGRVSCNLISAVKMIELIHTSATSISHSSSTPRFHMAF